MGCRRGKKIRSRSNQGRKSKAGRSRREKPLGAAPRTRPGSQESAIRALSSSSCINTCTAPMLVSRSRGKAAEEPANRLTRQVEDATRHAHVVKLVVQQRRARREGCAEEVSRDNHRASNRRTARWRYGESGCRNSEWINPFCELHSDNRVDRYQGCTVRRRNAGYASASEISAWSGGE